MNRGFILSPRVPWAGSRRSASSFSWA